MDDFLLGMNAKIYQGPTGTDLATLTEMSNVKDVTLSLEAGEADVPDWNVGIRNWNRHKGGMPWIGSREERTELH